MARTPYELRFDIINMAMCHLRDEYFAEQDRHNKHYQHNKHKPFTKDYPTLDKALELAAQIQAFVNDDRK